jgi:hypothetical protein
MLQALANIPVLGWYAASIADVVGFSGQWTSLSGSVMGFGGGSEAIFTNVSYVQALDAVSCFKQNVQNGLIYVPTVCTPATLPRLPGGPVLFNPLDSVLIFQAQSAPLGVTAETNNLFSYPPVLDCKKLYECILSGIVRAP